MGSWAVAMKIGRLHHPQLMPPPAAGSNFSDEMSPYWALSPIGMFQGLVASKGE